METIPAESESIKQPQEGSGALAARPARRLPPELAVGGPVPDWCNLGVTLRVMLSVNALFCAVAAGEAVSWSNWVDLYLRAALVVEPVLVASLLFGCLLRRATAMLGDRVQVVIAVVLPAFMTFAVQVILGPLAGVDDALMLRNTLTAALVAALVLYWFHLQNQSNLPALAEARLQALQARIRPHFLFNSLNAVLGLIRTEPRRAETMLEDLADLFRVLMRDRRDRVLLAEEIALCRKYLAIEAMRLGDRLAVEISIAGEAEDALVPVLLLQPLVENAVHHGIEPASQPGRIEVVAIRQGSTLEVLVTSPWLGPGVSRPGNRMGLENVRQRLRLLHDLEARLDTGVRGNRYEARVRLPYIEAP